MLRMTDIRDVIPEPTAPDAGTPHEGEQGITLSEIDLLVLKTHRQMPLATIREVKAVRSLKESAVRTSAKKLERGGLLAGDEIDWRGKRRPVRRHLTSAGLRRLGVVGPTWHDPGNRGHLLKRLLPLKRFYRMIGRVRGLGEFREFLWLEGSGLDAIAKFENGWIGLVWSGTMEGELHLVERLSGMAGWLQDHATTDQAPWPAQIWFVVQDIWQKVVLSRALKQLAWDPTFAPVWCPKDGDCPEHTIVLESRGDVRQQANSRNVGRSSWSRRVRGCIFNLTDFEMTVLETIVETRGMPIPWLKIALREPPKSRRIAGALTKMTERGLAFREKQRGKWFFFASDATYQAFADRDGVPDPTKRPSRETDQNRLRRLYRHEHGLKSTIRDVMAGGIVVVNGDRGWEDMGKEGGGIGPDAIAWLRDTPGGARTWCYLEYELSARGLRRIREKLRGYDSALRQDAFPLLVVAFDDKAEQIFQRAAAPLGIRMLTTTVKRLKEHGPVGNDRCWSLFGLTAYIG